MVSEIRKNRKTALIRYNKSRNRISRQLASNTNVNSSVAMRVQKLHPNFSTPTPISSLLSYFVMATPVSPEIVISFVFELLILPTGFCEDTDFCVAFAAFARSLLMSGVCVCFCLQFSQMKPSEEAKRPIKNVVNAADVPAQTLDRRDKLFDTRHCMGNSHFFQHRRKSVFVVGCSRIDDLCRRLGQAAGSEKLGCSLMEVDPGKAAWPFHAHTVSTCVCFDFVLNAF